MRRGGGREILIFFLSKIQSIYNEKGHPLHTDNTRLLCTVLDTEIQTAVK